MTFVAVKRFVSGCHVSKSPCIYMDMDDELRFVERGLVPCRSSRFANRLFITALGHLVKSMFQKGNKNALVKILRGERKRGVT